MKFTGTICRTDDFSGTPLNILPNGILVCQGGYANWRLTSMDLRVAGFMESYRMLFNLKGGFFPGETIEGNAHARFTLFPTAGDGTWEGVFECLYQVVDGINFHTLILNGRGTGIYEGMKIIIKQTHEIPFAASIACWWPEVEPWPFEGCILDSDKDGGVT
jgi:hypothetical protein